MSSNSNLFDGMVLFCEVVEQGGLTTAANRLGHSPSHVSKVLARLEQRLGSRLLNRTTRKISLTETGRIYYESSRRLVADAKVIEDRIELLGDHPYGELKMSVPVIFAQGCFSAWVPEYLRAYPEVRLNLDASDRLVDLVAESFDLAVRIGHLPESDLVARELFQTRLITVAAPEYLRRRGVPEHPRDLDHHELIVFYGGELPGTWMLQDADGAAISIDTSTRTLCNETDVQRQLVGSGQGITQTLEFAYADDIDSGRLIPVLTGFEPPSVGIHLLYPNREFLPPKTRVMADFLIEKAARFKFGA